VNNPLCTVDAIIILTPTNAAAAGAGLFVAGTADGSFTVDQSTRTDDSDFNYFIITPIAR
jgi:hypothetical protein